MDEEDQHFLSASNRKSILLSGAECHIINNLLTELARAVPGNIGPRSFLYAPPLARSILSRPPANIPQYGPRAQLVIEEACKKKNLDVYQSYFRPVWQKERHFKDDILRAKQNVFQVTGSPIVICLIVCSIGQVSVECRPSVHQVSAKCRPSVGEVSVT